MHNCLPGGPATLPLPLTCRCRAAPRAADCPFFPSVPQLLLQPLRYIDSPDWHLAKEPFKDFGGRMGEFLDQVSWEQDLWTSVVEGAMRGMPWLTDVAWPGRTWPERKHEYSGIDWELPADWQERLNATTGEPGRRLAATRLPGALAAAPCGLLLCGSVSWNPMCCPESALNPTPWPPISPSSEWYWYFEAPVPRPSAAEVEAAGGPIYPPVVKGGFVDKFKALLVEESGPLFAEPYEAAGSSGGAEVAPAERVGMFMDFLFDSFDGEALSMYLHVRLPRTAVWLAGLDSQLPAWLAGYPLSWLGWPPGYLGCWDSRLPAWLAVWGDCPPVCLLHAQIRGRQAGAWLDAGSPRRASQGPGAFPCHPPDLAPPCPRTQGSVRGAGGAGSRLHAWPAML